MLSLYFTHILHFGLLKNVQSFVSDGKTKKNLEKFMHHKKLKKSDTFSTCHKMYIFEFTQKQQISVE